MHQRLLPVCERNGQPSITWHKHVPHATIHSPHTLPRHHHSFQPTYIRICLADLPTIHSPSTEVTLHGRRQDEAEANGGVLDGEGLVEQKGSGFGRTIETASGRWDQGGEC
jgi:hypothetical protein